MKEKVLLIKKFSKLEYKYWLVVRLKTIKYKEGFFCYLSFIASFQTFSSP